MRPAPRAPVPSTRVDQLVPWRRPVTSTTWSLRVRVVATYTVDPAAAIDSRPTRADERRDA